MQRIPTILLALTMIFADGMRSSAQPSLGFALCNAGLLRDTLPSLFYNDSAWTPEGAMGWNSERYERKTMQTAALLDSLGMPVAALFGAENESVVRDVVSRCESEYSYVHRTADSYDGSDFVLLYYADKLFPSRVRCSRRSMTVEAEYEGVRYAFILCNRENGLSVIVRELRARDPGIRIVAAGVFDDRELRRSSLRDLTRKAASEGRGTVRDSRGWRMADRIAADTDAEAVCDVYVRRWLLDRSGAPAATYEGTRYTGGTGGHLPLFARLRYKSD
ncbi:MAG: hypothetical protein J1E04_06760 [Alistipes sp.]|nr:hypothetical protein [Alistipes sp.]